MSIESERERLSQAKMLAYFRREMRPTEMITVSYSSGWSDPSHNLGVHCALIPSGQLEQTFSSPTWKLSWDGGLPGAIQYYKDEKQQAEYLRFGNESGVEPLVLHRDFYDIRPDYSEINEEFRLFHRLYHDHSNDHYIKIDDDGNEHIVAVVEPSRIKIRLKEIRQFLAIKEMYLAIQFDCAAWSGMSLEELGLTEGPACSRRDQVSRWQLSYGEWEPPDPDRQSLSRLLGFRLIEPLPKSKSEFPGFAEEPDKRHTDFIIGLDENGDEIRHTCNPDTLANFFGANRGAPNYVTPVSFRKEVLDKYYRSPGKYKVEDGYLRCASVWILRIDNHHDDKVVVMLGDLGRDLPYSEQHHWRAYNFPSETGFSQTSYERGFLAQWSDSDRPEHIFPQRYYELAEVCQEHLRWPLLRPLGKDDEHLLQNIRVPATNEQPEFDELVLGLTKVLVDSLNERKLNRLIPREQRESLRGSISRLEAALSACGVDDAGEHIAFLRDLQSLRSSGPAHRRGREYQRIAARFELDSQDKRTVFEGILRQAIAFLDYLIEIVGGEAGLLRKTTSGRTNTRR